MPFVMLTLIFFAFSLHRVRTFSEYCNADGTDCRQNELYEDLRGKLLVAAIDFGTTYSGWAFLFKHEYEKDPTAVNFKKWYSEDHSSLKAPTTVLIEPDGRTIAAFGYDAETKYAKLAATNKHKQYYYFKRFKMLLDGKQDLTRQTTIADDQGHVLPAITIFSLVIKYLKQDLHQFWLGHGWKVEDSEVRWVLTVPAIWTDKAKQFMREAAIQGGINGRDLLIALEPEAASLYCRLTPIEKMEDDEGSFIATLKTGSKYMIIDAGGGTVDITVHEVMHKRYLREIHKADGGPWGGTKVDELFSLKLETLFGEEVFRKFRMECAYEYLELFREFETKKRKISPDYEEETIIKLSQCLTAALKSITGETVEDRITSSKYRDKLVQTWDRLLISADIAKEFFQDAIDSVVKKVDSLLQEPNLEGADSILLVGGFSESKMLQTAIRKSFPDMKVFIPKDAGLVVLKGAVIFGFDPSLIAVRVCKYTYGVAYIGPFMEGRCERDETLLVDGVPYCNNLFKQFVKVGEEVRYDETQGNKSFVPLYEHLEEVDVSVYACNQPSPVLVTEKGCINMGHVTVQIRDRTVPREERVLLVTFTFSGTEIEVTAIEERTGEETSVIVDFLG